MMPETRNGRSGTTPMVSVVVLTRNRVASLERTLNALADLDYPNFETIVVDNDSSDGTRELIQKYKQVVYLFAPSEFGIGHCRQLGVQNAKGEIIAFCDDDCVPVPHWLNSITRRLMAEPDIGALAGQVINVGFPKENRYAEMMRHKGRSKLGKNGRLIFVEDTGQAEFFGNMNLAMRKDVMNQVGGYDTFFNTMEEIDLELRIRKLGYRVEFEPEALLEHHYTGTRYKSRQFFYGPQLVRLYFCMKHFRPRTGFEWAHFFKNEMQIFVREFIRTTKKFVAAVTKGKLDRLVASSVDAMNMITARLAIPWLLWQVRMREESRIHMEA
jgi:GT2 family glycosyltransferase